MPSIFRNLLESKQADSLHCGLLIVDRSGKVKQLNKIAASFLGDSSEKLIGKKLSDFFDSKLCPNFFAADRALQTCLKLKVLSDRDEIIYLKVDCAALEDGSDFLVSLIDISEQYHLELQLIDCQKLQSLGELTAGVAHDFNNLLGGIRGGVDVIERTLNKSGQDSELSRRIDLVRKCVTRASDLSRQLLNFARRRKTDKSSFKLVELVDEIIAIIEKTTVKTITFVKQLPDDLSDVIGDMGQISSVLMNLGINAVDAIDSVGEVRFIARNIYLSAEMARNMSCPEGWYVQLEVSDSGSGIPPENLDKIFDAFFTTKASSNGTGLGLSMARKIIANHGGRICVRSKVGEGSSFEIILPCQPVKSEVKKNEEMQLDGTRILLVDDDDLLLQVTRQILEHLGAEVVVACGGKEALAACQTLGKFDLAILDMMMPDWDGLRTYKELRNSGLKAPVLFYSGYSFPEELNAIAKGGKVELLGKPFEVSELTDKIQRLID